MKRIGVFVLYDASGQVDDYVCFLLNSMLEVVQRLIVIINGAVKSSGYKKLEECSNVVFVRENYGYDAGAYKDAFIKFLAGEKWENWDEIILFNDTFYGPFYPWKELFKEMDEEEADFWGLSRHPGGGDRLMTGREVPWHIQAYFLVCKRPLFLSPCWKDFWDTLEYPGTYHEAVEKFEVYFSEYFTGKGYQSAAFSDRINIDIAYGRNPCICYFYPLIKEGKFPIIKKKAFRLESLNKAMEIMDYIEKCFGYSVEMVVSNMRRLCREKQINPLAPFDADSLEQFYKLHQRVFIYGHGNYGRGIAEYFRYKGWKPDGFIVTDNVEKDSDVLIYDTLHFGPEDGIILALGEKAFCEVYQTVKRDMDAGQLCCPQYDFEKRYQ